MSKTTEEIVKAIDEARAFRHRFRAMRVTLECGHLRLIPEINTVMGIGAYTACVICPQEFDEILKRQRHVSRQVVNVEETGVLHDDWAKKGA